MLPRRYRAAVLSVLLTWCAGPLVAQEVAASTAAAQGWEGLFFNPAAVALQRYQVLGLSGSFGSSFGGGGYGRATGYSYGLTLSNSLHLQYTPAETPAPAALEARYALGFPVVFPLYAGFGLAADLASFSWAELQLSGGLLWYPHRALALALVGDNLLHPAQRLYTGGVALRPLGERLTVFADLSLKEDLGLDLEALDSALGLRVEPLPGLELGLRVSDRFSEYLAQLDLHTGATSFGVFWVGQDDLAEQRFGARVSLDARPRRSAVRIGPRTCQVLLTRPLVRGSTQADSPENVDTLLTALRRLAADGYCRTLILRFDGSIILSPDVLEEVLGALQALKSSGKRIVAYIDSSFSQFDYLAAAAADTLVVSPYTVVPLVGVGAQLLFFKGLFDRLGIDVEYARSSDYKSALDTLLREDLSEENRRQLEEYLGETHSLMVRTLASSRRLEETRARELIDGGPYWCEEAVTLGLADEVLYKDAFEEKYLKGSTTSALSLEGYQERAWRRPAVAVVKAQGPITAAQNVGPWQLLLGTGAITEKSLVPLLESLKRDPGVAAVVVQVDSPGGDGLVSDRIWKAIRELAEKKPVACVMGGVAASGGYYLAMAGDKLFTHRTTLTGSIGSYIFKPVVTRLLERYGVNVDSVKLGENVDLFSPLSALSQAQRAKLESLNQGFEGRFYDRVAESRSLPRERVEAIGGGRIYAGAKAVELGLADEIGGVSEALRYLETRLELSEGGYELRYVPDWRARLRAALGELNQSRQRSGWMLSPFRQTVP
jgi:protease-4